MPKRKNFPRIQNEAILLLLTSSFLVPLNLSAKVRDEYISRHFGKKGRVTTFGLYSGICAKRQCQSF